MSEITKVQVEYGETFNIGNYENIKLMARLEKQLQPGDSQKEEVAISVQALRKVLHEEFRKIMAERKE